MFQLSQEELENWRSQFVMSNPAAKMGLRRSPYVFTEQGVAMLSSAARHRLGSSYSTHVTVFPSRLTSITVLTKSLFAK